MKLPNDVVSLLEGSGLPWEIIPKKRHVFIAISGKVVTKLPLDGGVRRSGTGGRAHLNVLGEIRRYLRSQSAAVVR